MKQILSRFNRRGHRRGVTIIVVLGLISIALALSFSIMRSQGTALQVRGNGSRRANARQAALSGLAAALRKMHQNDWAGVDVAFTGVLSPEESFSVSFTTGDPSLTAVHPDYSDWPYRVTLVSTGSAVDATAGGAASTHQVQAVVRLVPRQLSATPADWSAMQNYTLYQHHSDDFMIDLPCRVEGRLWLQGTAQVCTSYPGSSTARTQYLSDLTAMKTAGKPDYRPISGPIDWQKNSQSASTQSTVNSLLGVSSNNVASYTAANWNAPQSATTYRIYPGGKAYGITTVSDVLQSTTLGPDPKTNPLGIYLRNGAVELRSNVTIRGMLISTVDIFITGQNVQLQAIDMPALSGETSRVRLQAATAADDFRVFDTGGGSVSGVLAVWDEFEVKQGSENMSFDLLGRLVTRKFTIQGRNEWSYSSLIWGTLLTVFQLQAAVPPPVGTPYFPQYMANLGRNPAPRITLKPDPTPYRYHWFQASLPVYAPHPSDPGLRWDVLSWADSP